jgi:molybdopterin-guanine dinucleotide biosynthesis protein A
MPLSSKRTAIILAGGQGSRFGSNKALALLAGKPLVSHVTERLSHIADETLVVIGHGERRADYEAILPSSAKVINDCQEGKTPLIGIVTGLQAASSEYAFICACDTPFVNERVVELLFRRASGADAAIPRWNGGHIEPLEAVYRTASTVVAVRETLTVSGQPLRVMIGKLAQVVYVSVEDEVSKLDPDMRTFFNVNSREDMEAAEQILSKTLSAQGANVVQEK